MMTTPSFSDNIVPLPPKDEAGSITASLPLPLPSRNHNQNTTALKTVYDYNIRFPFSSTPNCNNTPSASSPSPNYYENRNRLMSLCRNSMNVEEILGILQACHRYCEELASSSSSSSSSFTTVITSGGSSSSITMSGIVNQCTRDGYTALHYCALSTLLNRTAIVKGLVQQYGANINCMTNLGYTPLGFACQHGNYEVAKILLELGCQYPLLPDVNGWTPFLLAVKSGNYDLVQYLLQYLNDSARKSSLMSTLSSPTATIPNDNNDYANLVTLSPMEIALRIGYTGKNPVNLHMMKDISPLHLACQYGNVQLVKLLLQYGANIHKEIDPTSYMFPSATPLMYAAGFGKSEIVEELATVLGDEYPLKMNPKPSVSVVVGKPNTTTTTGGGGGLIHSPPPPTVHIQSLRNGTYASTLIYAARSGDTETLRTILRLHPKSCLDELEYQISTDTIDIPTLHLAAVGSAIVNADEESIDTLLLFILAHAKRLLYPPFMDIRGIITLSNYKEPGSLARQRGVEPEYEYLVLINKFVGLYGRENTKTINERKCTDAFNALVTYMDAHTDAKQELLLCNIQTDELFIDFPVFTEPSKDTVGSLNVAENTTTNSSNGSSTVANPPPSKLSTKLKIKNSPRPTNLIQGNNQTSKKNQKTKNVKKTKVTVNDIVADSDNGSDDGTEDETEEEGETSTNNNAPETVNDRSNSSAVSSFDDAEVDDTQSIHTKEGILTNNELLNLSSSAAGKWILVDPPGRGYYRIDAITGKKFYKLNLSCNAQDCSCALKEPEITEEGYIQQIKLMEKTFAHHNKYSSKVINFGDEEENDDDSTRRLLYNSGYPGLGSLSSLSGLFSYGGQGGETYRTISNGSLAGTGTSMSDDGDDFPDYNPKDFE